MECTDTGFAQHRRSYGGPSRYVLLPLAGFALTFFLLWLLLAESGFALTFSSGADRTFLVSDAQSQYVAYFRLLRRVLAGDGDLFYTGGKPLGGNLLSLAAYYLVSPFNWLLLAWPADRIALAVEWLVVLKLATAGLTATVFLMLYPRTQANGIANLAFAVAYALCSYAIGYLWSPMWLDGFLVLPVVVLGLEYVLADRNPYVYPLALAYALATSWYMGYMIGAGALLWFAFRLAETPVPPRHTPERRAWWHRVGSFGAGSLAGGLLSAPLLLAAVSHFGGTKAGFSFPAQWFYNPLDPIRNSVLGTYRGFAAELATYRSRGLAFVGIYVGGPALVFASLFFFSRELLLRRRLVRLGLLAFFFLIMALAPLDTLIQGGRVPNWFPARYAFLAAFLLAVTGAEGYAGIKTVRLPALLLPPVLYGVGVGVAAALDATGAYTPSLLGGLVWFGALAVAAILRLGLGARVRPLRRQAGPSRRRFLVPGLALASGILVVALSAAGLYGEGRTILGDPYLAGGVSLAQAAAAERFQTAVDAVKDRERTAAGDLRFFRMENTFIAMDTDNGIDNDPLYYGFNGLSHYSSVS